MYRLALASLLLAIACGDSTTGPTGGTGGQPIVAVGDTCEAFCAKVVGECNAFEELDEPNCQQLCQQDLNNEYQQAEPCGDASRAVFECATELDCEGVEAWKEQSPPDSFPCQPEVAVFDSLVASRICLPG